MHIHPVNLHSPIEVHTSDKALELIHASSDQGRKFPQALGEVFGRLSSVLHVEIDVFPKSHLFAVAGADSWLMKITVKHKNEALPDFEKIINADDLTLAHPTGAYGFNALLTAQEFARLYQEERYM